MNKMGKAEAFPKLMVGATIRLAVAATPSGISEKSLLLWRRAVTAVFALVFHIPRRSHLDGGHRPPLQA